jgi:hypothetical protein
MKYGPQARWFLAGVGFGILFMFVTFAIIACQSVRPSGPAFSLVQPGTTLINLPCAVVCIEVRTNPEKTVYWWRIAVIPRVTTIPPKPEKELPEA